MAAVIAEQQATHTPLPILNQEGDKSLTNFECPGCAKRKGGHYSYGKIDMDALRERGVSVAAVVEATVTQGEEEAGGGELGSNACTWPPPEAEYFFGEEALRCLLFAICQCLVEQLARKAVSTC